MLKIGKYFQYITTNCIVDPQSFFSPISVLNTFYRGEGRGGGTVSQSGGAQCIRIGVMEDNFVFGHILHFGHSLFFCVRVKSFSAYYLKAITVNRMGAGQKVVIIYLFPISHLFATNLYRF